MGKPLQEKWHVGSWVLRQPGLNKARVLNKFVIENNVATVLEFGCGDGNQLKEFRFPQYTGLDISKTAIEKCTTLFESDHSKSFFIYDPVDFAGNTHNRKADLTLSLDVVYHLLEDDMFEAYMKQLFSASTRFVIIYAWDVDAQTHFHIRHRKFTQWIHQHMQEWEFVQIIENKTTDPVCDFFIYRKRNV